MAVDRQLPRSLARLGSRRLGYLEGDLTRLPLPDASLDAVFCISVLEHLPPERARAGLQELRRVLHPEGRLLLTTDLAEDPDEEMWFDGPEEPPFRVDWALFDEARVRDVLLAAPGLHVEGEVDLHVDWPRERPRLRAFHGCPTPPLASRFVAPERP